MPITGIYFLPTSQTNSSTTLTLTIDHLTKTLNPTPLPRWSLDHRLFRSVVSSNSSNPAPATSPPQRYLHILTLPPPHSIITPGTTSFVSRPSPSVQGLPRSSIATATTSASSTTTITSAPQPTTYVLITPPTPITPTSHPGTIISIPTPQTDELAQLLQARLAPLWTARQTLSVTGGSAFEVDNLWLIRVGEVKSSSGSEPGTAAVGSSAAGSALQGVGKGVVVEVTMMSREVDLERDKDGEGDEQAMIVETLGGEKEETEEKNESEDWVFGEQAILDLWELLELEGGKGVIRGFGVGLNGGKGDLEEGMGVARQWCEVLRLRP